MLVAVDPGVRACGVALFSRSLYWAGLVYNPCDRTGSTCDRTGYTPWLVMADTVADVCKIKAMKADRIILQIVIELPQVYSRSHSKGDPNDLITLAATVGALAARLEGLAASQRGVAASQRGVTASQRGVAASQRALGAFQRGVAASQGARALAVSRAPLEGSQGPLAIDTVLPAQWKGQVPKKVLENRLRAKLSPEELRAVELPTPSLAHNVWDAIGLGCWALSK